MKADLTRFTFNVDKHYRTVRMQQGRVQLDADWNEQSSIMLYQLRHLAADIIGPAGGPADNLGFAIAPLDTALAKSAADFMIGAGKGLDTDRYFVICTDAIANGLTTSPSNSKNPSTSSFGRPQFSVEKT